MALLSGCAGRRGLPPEQVLKNAATQSQQLDSTNFTGEATVQWSGDDALYNMQASLTGSLVASGRDTHIYARTNGTVKQRGQSYDVRADLQMVSLDGKEVYVRVGEVTSDPVNPLLVRKEIQSFIGHWWQLPGGEGAPVSPESITPDPRLLRAQLEVVTVLKDNGIHTVNGRDVYLYDVGIDQQKLLEFLQALSAQGESSADAAQAAAFWRMFTARGSLVIDAHTFAIERLAWQLQPTPESNQSFSVNFFLDFMDRNHGEPVMPPQGAQQYVMNVGQSRQSDGSVTGSSASAGSAASSEPALFVRSSSSSDASVASSS